MTPQSARRVAVSHRGHRFFAHQLRGSVLLVTVIAGLLLPSSALADNCGLAVSAGMSPTQHSILLAEAQDPANFPDSPEWFEVTAGMSVTQRSIIEAEGTDAGNFPVKVATNGLELHAGMTSTQHSILLQEAQDPANFPTPAAGC